MRRKLVLGVGLAALVGSPAVGQFAADRQPPASAPTSTPLPPVSPSSRPSSLPGTFQPATSTTPASQLGGFSPLTPPVMPSSPASSTPRVSPTTPGYTPLYSSPSTPSTGAYVPPVNGIRPVNYSTPAPTTNIRTNPTFTALAVESEIPTAIPKDHPWRLKPEHGPWFILVKSYVRPAKGSRAAEMDRGLSSLELAEGLASEIRETYRVQAFLFEYVPPERIAEMRAVVAARQKAAKEYVAQLEALKQKAQLQGMDFLEPDNKLHIMRHNHRDQIGVLVGGFQTEADARKALVKLKTWPAPKNEMLMDGGAIAREGPNGKPVFESTRLNPYATAFVVSNPTSAPVTNTNTQPQGLDPFIVRLNEGNPYNLLKAKKGWTLGVKSFTSPVEIVNKDSDPSLMRKWSMNKGRDILAAGGEQAEAMAKALRAMKGPGGQPLNLEAYVLHTRNASLVTVGQFDSPDDPAMQATKRLIGGIKINVGNGQTGSSTAMGGQSLFDHFNLVPMPIPKP